MNSKVINIINSKTNKRDTIILNWETEVGDDESFRVRCEGNLIFGVHNDGSIFFYKGIMERLANGDTTVY